MMNVRSSWNKYALTSLLLLLGVFGHGAYSVAADFDKGLLWKIEAAGAAPSYLFGTMHSEDEDVLRLPPAVRNAFDKSSGVTLEVVMDISSLLAMTSAFMLTDGSKLETHVGPALYRRAVAALGPHGLPEAMVASMKPWAVAVTLMTPPTKTGMVLDLMLYQQAVAAGKPVEGLETPMEQIAVFDQLSKKDQITLLKDALDNLGDMPRMFGALKDAYLARDLKRLEAISDDSMRDLDPGLVERFNSTLITQRNHRMAERMQSGLKRGRQFIAVGALHLPGEQGLLNLLQKQGYRIQRVY